MRYLAIILAVVFIAGCSSSSSGSAKADSSVLQFVAPTITDQEFEDGLPAPGIEYSKEVSYEAQLKQDGGTYIKSKTPAKKATKKTTSSSGAKVISSTTTTTTTTKKSSSTTSTK